MIDTDFRSLVNKITSVANIKIKINEFDALQEFIDDVHRCVETLKDKEKSNRLLSKTCAVNGSLRITPTRVDGVAKP